ncbi:type IV toxin-antitoxin system AbiEi family antitoxin domain-containing protein [Treponema sp.]|uniref:type IV toxin-antitoxin system AbiEi family antitoxin domain-containing protein n=1 Tax=Treponema sp. TaxID=166 RepID=UPI00388CF4B7
MKNNSGTNLKLLFSQPQNTVMTVKGLVESGLKHYEILRFEKSGIIKRLSSGAYSRFNENPDVFGAVNALQRDLKQSSHIGGRTALALVYGKIQYAADRKIEIFSYKQEKFPTWFKTLYSSSCIQFMTDFLPSMEGLNEWKHDGYTSLVSAQERALLELLYQVPNSVTPQEAFEIMQLITVIKPSVMQKLLENCKSIKTKRMLLCFAELCGHQWFHRLKTESMDLGSGIREITKGGKLYSNFNLVLPEGLESL